MIEVRPIECAEEKWRVADGILRALPDWFGNESAIVDYARECRDLPVCAAYDGDRAVGFLAVKRHTAHAFELCVMGVLVGWHRQGVGRMLVEAFEGHCRALGAEFLTVKTLAEAHPDPYYARTRKFYGAMGFRTSRCSRFCGMSATPAC